MGWPLERPNKNEKLRKTLNDAKRLSLQLCSFAHFRVFRSSKLIDFGRRPHHVIGC